MVTVGLDLGGIHCQTFKYWLKLVLEVSASSAISFALAPELILGLCLQRNWAKMLVKCLSFANSKRRAAPLNLAGWVDGLFLKFFANKFFLTEVLLQGTN